MSKMPVIECVGGIKSFSSTTKIGQDASVKVGTKIVLDVDGDVSTDELRDLIKRGPVKITLESSQLKLVEVTLTSKSKAKE